MNRIYNLYLVRNRQERSAGPQTQIVLCKEHLKRYKQLLKKDPMAYALHLLRGRKTAEPCFWCEDPEEFEVLEASFRLKEEER